MNTPLTVAAHQGPVRRILATLPDQLRIVDGGSADLVAVDGAPGWPQRLQAAAESGAAGIMVLDPVPAEPPQDVPVPVVVDTRWAGNPAAVAAAERFSRLEDGEAFLDAQVITAPGPDPGRDLLALATLMRVSTSGLRELVTVRATTHGYDGIGRLRSGAAVNVGVLRTASVPPRAVLRVIRNEGAVHLELPDPGTAAPGRLLVTDDAGSTLRRTEYESVHRAAWRRLHDAVRGGSRTDDLTGLASDALLVSRAMEEMLQG